MLDNPLVSIIVNCKNGEKYLNQALKSVINQTYTNWELIFFDNFSTDSSKKILLSYDNKKFKYFLNEEESNLSVARNRAIKKAQGQIITILDHDDWWKQNKLKEQVKFFEKNDLDFVFTDYYQIYENLNKSRKIRSKIKGDFYSSIINNYNLGLNTFAFNANIFKKHCFDNDYHIIGDFSLIVEISKNIKWKRLSIPYSFYRIHNYNETNKNELLHIKELKHWYQNKFRKIENNKKNKKKIINKITYMKFKSNINIGNKDYLINFKHTNFFSIYKLKEIFYIIKNFFIKYKIN